MKYSMSSSSPRGIVYILFAGLVLQTSAQITVPNEKYEQPLCTTVILECNVIGQTPTNLTWKHNQEHLDTSSGRYSNGDKTIPSLTINNVQVGDNGTYQCIATYNNVIRESRIITLTVTPSSSSNAQGGTAPSNVAISQSPTIAQAGNSLTLSCTANGGTSLTTYAWSKDNFVTTEYGSVLTFSPLTSADTATYTCKAANCYGEALAQVFVNVLYKPSKPTVVPSSVTVTLGNLVSLACTAAGNPVVSYNWYKDGNFNNVISNDANFRINSASVSDNGTYICQAGNSVGSTNSDPVTVDVQYGPTQAPTVNPTSVDVVAGQLISVTCTATGNPAVTYAWFKDNSNNAFQTGPELRISNPTANDAGTYTCRASNGLGSTQTTVTVIVGNQPSTITINPTNVNVTQGGSFSLTCNAAGNPPPSYQWYRNGVIIASSSVLTKDNVQYNGDNGDYVCRATNSRGSIQGTANVNVQYGPTQAPTVNPTSVDVVAGQLISVICTATGNPAVTYAWFKDNSNNAFQTGPELRISNPTANDAGTYTCRASNGLGSTQTTVTVIVGSLPSGITINPTNINVTQGGSFTLTCSASGNPSPTYQWYRNEVLIPGSNVLTKTNVQYNGDNGDYVCRATNSRGTIQGSASVNIQYKPISSSTPPSPVAAGTTITLDCETNANPPATSYIWVFNGNNVATTKTYDVTVDTAANYMCRVSNGIGTTDIWFNITLASSLGPDTGAATTSTGLTTGEIAAIVLAILFVLLLIIGLIICCCCTGYCAGVCGQKKDKVEPTKEKYHVEEPDMKVRTLEIPRFYEHTEPPTEVKKLRHKKPKMYRRSSNEFEINKYTVLKPDESKEVHITSREYASDNLYEGEMHNKENLYITANETNGRDHLYISDSGTREKDDIYITDNGYRNYYLPELEYTYDYEEERRRRRRRKKKKHNRHHRRHNDDTSRDNEIIVEETVVNGDIHRSSMRSRRNDEDNIYVRSGRENGEVIIGPEYYLEP